MPLQSEQHPLTDPEQEALNAVLVSNGVQILKRVVEAKASTILARAVNAAYNSNAGDGMLSQAEKDIDEAIKYRHCLDVLAELQAAKQHTELRFLTLKPSTQSSQ